MKPATHDLIIYQGSDYYKKFTFYTDTTRTTPTDLTAYTFAAMIRENYADASPLATFAIVDTDLANGVIYLQLTAIETAALSTTTGFWDLEVTDSGGKVNRYIEGSYTLDLEVTK